MSSPSQTIVSLLETLITGGEGNHGFATRFIVAAWGSLVMHLSMIAKNVVVIEQTPDIPLPILGAMATVSLLYCAVFGLIEAVGSVKGSLMRHFCLGALLPAFAYALARLATT